MHVINPPGFRYVVHNEVVHASQWVCWDEGEWRLLLRSISLNPAIPHAAPVLCDVRCAISLPPVEHGEQIARTLRALRGNRRVAIVTGDGAAYGVARQIELFTRGSAGAFTSVDEALVWLSAGDRPLPT